MVSAAGQLSSTADVGCKELAGLSLGMVPRIADQGSPRHGIIIRLTGQRTDTLRRHHMISSSVNKESNKGEDEQQ